MRALLDTHALLWWLLGDARLSPAAAALIRSSENRILVSSASAMEIAIKHRLNKLWLGDFEPSDLTAIMARERFDPLTITLEHALLAGTLPGPHRDPFDRILIAQSRLEGVPLISRDPAFDSYGVRLVW